MMISFSHQDVKQISGNAKSPLERAGFLKNYAGDHLISHTVSRAVPSAQRGLTSVFGMGTGVTLAVWSPANLRRLAGFFSRSQTRQRTISSGRDTASWRHAKI